MQVDHLQPHMSCFTAELKDSDTSHLLTSCFWTPKLQSGIISAIKSGRAYKTGLAPLL